MKRNVLIPADLFEGRYKMMSSHAKILYGLLLIESSESFFVDEDGKRYIEFSRRQIKEALNVANDKAREILNELEEADLIRREAVTGKNARIYIS